MKKTESDFSRFFDEMVKKGLISTGNGWIEKAIQTKNCQLPLAIANSSLLTYDRLDRNILTLRGLN